MAASKLMMVLTVIVIASVQLQSTVAQTRHVVGGTTGWTVPSGNSVNYTTWASQQTFNVGDSLFFNFTTGFHDVAEVTQAAYGPCTTTNPLSIATTGPATITLSTAGDHYYICTIGAGAHCQGGQKVTINVVGATGTPPASTTPAPSGSSTPTPTGSTTSPPPPSPSRASSFTAVVPFSFLAAALAFFY